MAADNITSDIKALAHSVKSELAQFGHDIPLGHVLETLAHLRGSRDWNTLKALADKGQLLPALAAVDVDGREPVAVNQMCEWLLALPPRPGRIWRLFEHEGGLKLQARFGRQSHERLFATERAESRLLMGVVVAARTELAGYVYVGGRVWRCAPNEAAVEAFALNEKRACLVAIEGRRNRFGSILVGYALEDEPGYHLTDFDFGPQLEKARDIVAQMNRAKGLTEEETQYIVGTSMFASGLRSDD